MEIVAHAETRRLDLSPAVDLWEPLLAQLSSPEFSDTRVVQGTQVVAVNVPDGRLWVLLAEERAAWTTQVTTPRGLPPRAEVEPWADVARRWLGGAFAGRFDVDLGALDPPGGTLLAGEGDTGRLATTARVDVKATATTWRFDIAIEVTARGIRRIALALFGARLRRAAAAAIADLLGEESTAGAARELRRLRVAIDAEGGPAAFVHRALWDEEFTWPTT